MQRRRARTNAAPCTRNRSEESQERSTERRKTIELDMIHVEARGAVVSLEETPSRKRASAPQASSAGAEMGRSFSPNGEPKQPIIFALQQHTSCNVPLLECAARVAHSKHLHDPVARVHRDFPAPSLCAIAHVWKFYAQWHQVPDLVDPSLHIDAHFPLLTSVRRPDAHELGRQRYNSWTALHCRRPSILTSFSAHPLTSSSACFTN